MKVLFSVLPSLLLVLFIVTVWQLTEDAINHERVARGETSLEFFIPTPRTIIEEGWNARDTIWRAMSATLQKSFVGFMLGTVAAVIIVILYDLFPIIRTTTFPIAFAIQSFPIIGLAPAIILLFGQDSFLSFVIVSAILTYFPILLSLDEHFNQLDNDYQQIAFIYNATRWQVLRFFKFPLSVSSFVTALKLAAPASIVGATIGEWIGSSDGIGRLITVSLYQLRPGVLYACLVLLALVSASTVLIIKVLEFVVFPWMRHERA